MKELILGGVKSGKSRMAESRAIASGLPVTYIATATAGEDGEMRQRIAEHCRRRPAHWQVVDEPLRLAHALAQHAAPGQCLLVDCLTLWLTNLLLAGDEARFERERNAFLSTLPELPGHIILVSNETSMGIIPMGELTRRFCDEAGRLHQELVRTCDRVILTFAGLPLVLKGEPL
jgi:adenosylcobinamide kinase/adenosylcobinamide-phosphate guanylyltransferase